MLEFDKAASASAHIRTLKQAGKSIGFVPTMGALHEGHLSLVRASLMQCDVTVVSIFVNPEQFNNSVDFENYPVQIQADLAQLKLLGCDLLFRPPVEEIYPSRPVVSIRFGVMEEVLEGAYRPGHFRGVGIVVAKLFNILQPDKAFFGLKDLQQYLLIQKMSTVLNFPLEVVGCPTVREPSGLALSSRNVRLSAAGRDTASAIYTGLAELKKKLQLHPLTELLRALRVYYQSIDGLKLEYAEAVDAVTLEPLHVYHPNIPAAICVAAYVEGVRLIDNLYLR